MPVTIGLTVTTVSGVFRRSASFRAQSRALRECSEPSTPTMMPGICSPLSVARPALGGGRGRLGRRSMSPMGETGDGTNVTGFLLDDHESVRRGVRDLINAEAGITVIGEAAPAASALARIPALKPDVAVLDIRLPDGDGVSVCRDIRSRMPEGACLILTSFGDDEALFDAINAGRARPRPVPILWHP